jgi:hypothetical protein
MTIKEIINKIFIVQLFISPEIVVVVVIAVIAVIVVVIAVIDVAVE